MFDKKYILFGGTVYYPYGGMSDYLGEFDTLEELTQKIKDWWINAAGYRDDLGCYLWYQIYDSVDKIVLETCIGGRGGRIVGEDETFQALEDYKEYFGAAQLC